MAIERVAPEIDGGRFPIKRVVGQNVVVQADVFADGHDLVSASLLHRPMDRQEWTETRMHRLQGDRFQASFAITGLEDYEYTVLGWIDRFRSWLDDLTRHLEAGHEVGQKLLLGAALVEAAAGRARGEDRDKLAGLAEVLRREPDGVLEVAGDPELGELMETHGDRLPTRYDKTLQVRVDRDRALFSAWYEMFPRSCQPAGESLEFLSNCQQRLPEVVRMGFDVLYLPPLHPIGRTSRKGRNNATEAGPGDPGSPWAIGSEEGGHKTIRRELGTMEDFENLLRACAELGLEVAMDLAFQCSRDHPYLKDHPEWFRWLPDGSIQFAENPPKRYEDIVPFDFETEAWRELWQELLSVVRFWMDKGIRIFRVDNPHTKPFPFWEWLIAEARKIQPEVIFISEAFTRPAVMKRLSKLGFSQSYTYFTWRNAKHEIEQYLEELTRTEMVEYFRPNFWPNTPDILPEFLQFGGRPAFVLRLVLAATLSSNYGIYGPAFELCVSEALPGKEEYLDSEKYQFRQWDWDRPGNLRDLIARVNQIRRENPSLWLTANLRFLQTDNDQLLGYLKYSDDGENLLLVVANLDPFHKQAGQVRVPVAELGIPAEQTYLVYDLLGAGKYLWRGEWNYVELDPEASPAHVFRVHRHLRREHDFDYYM